jgi:excisionase family DNA binding protein
LLTFEEASRYFGIGEGKLRNMANYGDTPNWIVHNGKRLLIKRTLLEEYLLNAETI